jgi:hypothetical protein
MPIKFKKVYQGHIPFSKLKFNDLVKLVENVSFDIVIEAKRTHRFKAQTGNLERSVKNNIETKQNRIISIFQLDNKIANYGKYIHNGFRSWKPDPFLLQAIITRTTFIKRQIRILMKKAR